MSSVRERYIDRKEREFTKRINTINKKYNKILADEIAKLDTKAVDDQFNTIATEHAEEVASYIEDAIK